MRIPTCVSDCGRHHDIGIRVFFRPFGHAAPRVRFVGTCRLIGTVDETSIFREDMRKIFVCNDFRPHTPIGPPVTFTGGPIFLQRRP